MIQRWRREDLGAPLSNMSAARAKSSETCSELTLLWAKGEAALSVRD
jgi:hypothetical protein